MGNKGAALIITMTYLLIISVICAVVLAFSSGHYKLISERVNRFQAVYYAEGGMYLGLQGSAGLIYIESGNANSTVNVSEGSPGVNSSHQYDTL